MSESEKDHNFIESSQPSVTEYENNDTVILSYHWHTEDDRHIYLYITFALKNGEKGSFYVVRSNFDSSEVRGQGKYLLRFYEQVLENTAVTGLKGATPKPILAEVSPNEFSDTLFKNNPQYQFRDGKYYRFYPTV